MNPFPPTYVIKYWHANNQPDSHGNYVLIQGRRAGPISWLLSLIKIEPNVEMRCTRTHLYFTEGSLQGQVAHVTPMRNNCSISYGYEKPLMAASSMACTAGLVVGVIGAAIASLVLGGIGTVIGLVAGLVVGPVIGGVFYFLSKAFTLGFSMNSGELRRICFKRSLIERQAIDEADAEYVAQLVQSLIEARVGAAQRP